MNELGALFNRLRSRKETERKENSRRSSEILSSINLLIPWLIFAFANAVLIFGEYRVWHYVFQLTGREELAWGTLAATGIGSEIWFIAWKYPLATTWQKRMSVIMMFANFLTATYIGFGDFFISGNGTTYGANQDTLVMLIVGILLFDIVVGVLYFLIDRQISRDRLRAETHADLQDQKNTAATIEQMLNLSKGILSNMRELYDEYGEQNVEDMLALLAGDTGKDKKIVSGLQKTQFQKPAPMQAYNADASNDVPNPNGRNPQPQNQRREDQ